MNEKNFETSLTAFLAGAQEKVNKHYERYEGRVPTPTLTVEPGRRYLRIVSQEKSHSSVYVFIDTTNGDILKAASWKAPAKGARGNLFSPDGGLNAVDWHGARYLR